MKHWLSLVLVLILLLCGCAPTQEPTTPTDLTQPSLGVTDPVAPTGSQAPTEPEIPGLKRFTVTGFYGMGYLGDRIVLVRDDQGTGELCILEPATLEVVKTIRLAEGLVPAWEEIQITDMGIGFYDQGNRTMMFWNTELQELARITLPEGVLGKAWLSPDWKKCFYCTAQGIYVMDMQTHIEALLKQNPTQEQMLTGVLAEGTILRYSVRNAAGEQQTYLVDATTGMRVEESVSLDALHTWEDSYYLPLQEGTVRKLLFGTQTSQKLLWPKVENVTIHPVPGGNGVVTEHAISQENGATLYYWEYYDLESGRRTSEICIKNARLLALLPAGNGKIWCLSGNEIQEALYLWDTTQTPVEDTGVYVSPYYTADNPDRAGLATLQQELKEMGEAYGITILLWQDAVNNNSWDYTFEGEYFTQVYEKYLPALKKALDSLPAGFLQKAMGNDTRRLTISLVRSIHDIADEQGRRVINGIQYWLAEDKPCMALVLGEDLERSFYHQLGLLVDSQVLMRSKAYEVWSRRTPPGFSYDNDYIKNLDRTDTRYTLPGDGRYFINMFSMSYAKEDRATVFEYACMLGSEEVFAAPIVQGKLQQVCLAIRDAFGLKDADGPFLWEQHLKS